jgi:iron complex outermembrane receptor protein
MNDMKKSLFLMIFVFFSVVAFSQNSIIRGKITDENGNALVGAGITIKNSFLGVSSDIDGDYSFSRLNDGKYTLTFSFIGYEAETAEVDLKGEAVVNVTLNPEPYLTGEVLVNATRAGRNTPLAYSSIDREVIQKSNAGPDIPYLLGLTPSLVETSEAGNGVGYTSLRIRGTDANRINVTIDGIPLNDPESQQVFWVDLPDVASSVDNIQIQRGVGTSSNGSGAFGATVSIQTLNPDVEPTAQVTTSYGSFNTIKNVVSAGTGLIADKFAFNMRYSDIKSDGYIDHTGSNHQSAFLSATYRTARSRLKANVILGEEHTGLGWWGVPKDSLNTNRTYNPAGEYTDEYGNLQYYKNTTDNYNQDHYQLIYSFRASENLNLNAALHYTKGKGYYEEYKEDKPLTEYNMSPFNIGGDIIATSDLIQQKWMDNDFYGFTYSLNYIKSRVEFSAGGGLNRYDGDHYGNVIWMRYPGLSEKDFEWYFNNSVKTDFNIFSKMNYDLSDKLKVYGDVQYRFIDYSMSGIDDDLKNLSQGHRFNFFNPKAGLFYSVNQNQDIWMSFSVANREPTRTDFKEASGDPNATPKPETLYDTELGYKLRRGKSSFMVNLYGMYYTDQLVPTGELSNVGYSIMTNVDKSYRIGIELSSTVRFGNHVLWNSNLTLSRNKILNFREYYTDYNTTDWSSQYLSRDLGNVDIAYSPSAIWSNDIAYESGIFDIHFISKYVGKQYFDNTMNNDRSIDPYFVNNIRFDVRPELKNYKGLELQLMVNNIFNEKYENNAYGGTWYEDGRENTWSYYFPQAGINYILRLALKF